MNIVIPAMGFVIGAQPPTPAFRYFLLEVRRHSRDQDLSLAVRGQMFGNIPTRLIAHIRLERNLPHPPSFTNLVPRSGESDRSISTTNLAFPVFFPK